MFHHLTPASTLATYFYAPNSAELHPELRPRESYLSAAAADAELARAEYLAAEAEARAMYLRMAKEEQEKAKRYQQYRRNYEAQRLCPAVASSGRDFYDPDRDESERVGRWRAGQFNRWSFTPVVKRQKDVHPHYDHIHHHPNHAPNRRSPPYHQRPGLHHRHDLPYLQHHYGPFAYGRSPEHLGDCTEYCDTLGCSCKSFSHQIAPGHLVPDFMGSTCDAPTLQMQPVSCLSCRYYGPKTCICTDTQLQQSNATCGCHSQCTCATEDRQSFDSQLAAPRGVTIVKLRPDSQLAPVSRPLTAADILNSFVQRRQRKRSIDQSVHKRESLRASSPEYSPQAGPKTKSQLAAQLLGVSVDQLEDAFKKYLGQAVQVPATQAPFIQSPPTESKPQSQANQARIEDLLQLFLAPGLCGESEKNKTESTAKTTQSTSTQVANNTQASSSRPSENPSTTMPKAASVAQPPSDSPTELPTLKAQLEARLNNEYAIEIRDTIQALLASLTDSAPASAPSSTNVRRTASSSSSSSPSSSSGTSHNKGKGKEVDNPEPKEATSKDVMHAMDEVRDIEAAFSALEADFVFPVQLDFTPPSTPPSALFPLPSISDADTITLPSGDSITALLAYTARNQPVRYYEHALGSLLNQLDLVESFGNELVRGRRKEAVAKVEKALEELEREVRGRWRAWEAKEKRKSVEVEIREEEPQVIAESSVGELVKEVEISEKPKDGEVEKDNAIGAAIELGHTEPILPTIPAEELPTEPEASIHSSPSSPPVDLSTFDEVIVPPEHTSVLSQTDEGEVPEDPNVDSDPEEVITHGDLSDPQDFESAPVSTEASVATITPSTQGAVSQEEEPVDTFLLPASPAPEAEKKKVKLPDDTEEGSEWSEVEAM